MKHILLVLLTFLFIKGYSQNEKSFSDKVKNKTLKAQIRSHEAISKEIIQIFEADKTARKYANAMTDKNAMEFRIKENLRADQAIMTDTYRLTHEDSVKLKLHLPDDLLYKKFLEYSDGFRFVGKLGKEDEKLQKQFYAENMKSVDAQYDKYFQEKNKHGTKYEKIKYKTLNFDMPHLIKCDGNTDAKKCFSDIFKSEIEDKYAVENYVSDYNTGLIKANIRFRITKNGVYEPLEVALSSHKYFLDMNAMKIAKDLFSDKRIAKPKDEDYYTEIPMTFNFED